MKSGYKFEEESGRAGETERKYPFKRRRDGQIFPGTVGLEKCNVRA